MGTHLRVLSESYPMNTNMTGGLDPWFSKYLHLLVLKMKVALALEGLKLEPLEAAPMAWWSNAMQCKLCVMMTLNTAQNFTLMLITK